MIFVCGFTYTLIHVTVNYICPMIFKKTYFILFYHGGSDALFVFISFFALLMLLSTNMNLAKHTEKQVFFCVFFLVLNYVQVTVIKRLCPVSRFLTSGITKVDQSSK